MPVTPYRPATELFRPFLDDFLSPATGSRMGDLLRAPEADVVETENEIRVMAELPGMHSENIQVELENNVLTINGEKREERTEEGKEGTWHLSERRYGKFSRSFVLPRDVEQERIQASFENGVLTVTIPKSEKARRRRIEVQGNAQTQRIGTESASR